MFGRYLLYKSLHTIIIDANLRLNHEKKTANPLSDYNYNQNPPKRKRVAEPLTPQSVSTQSFVT